MRAQLGTLSGFAAGLIFLKATVKKNVWIPQFTKKNGQVIGGHYAMVHVSDDHGHEKVASGQGTYSQKKAHAKLAKEEGDTFHTLPEGEKAALVMHHATQIQDEESMSARLATLKKKILAGEKPLGSELKAYHAAPHEKKIKLLQEAQEAGKLSHFDAHYAAWVAANPDQVKEAAAEAAQPAAQEPAKDSEPEPAKEAPKAAPAPAEPAAEAKPARTKEAADKFHADLKAELGQGPAAAPAKAPRIKSATANTEAETQANQEKLTKQGVIDALHDAKVVLSNTNAKSFNPKVDAIIAALEAGDEKALLGMSFGTNTYGKKAAKLANDALAHLGSSHTVGPGQKAGEHEGLKMKVASIKPAEPAPAPVAELPADPEQSEGNDGWPVMPSTDSMLISTTLQAAAGAAKNGDLASVQAMKDMLPAGAAKSHAYVDALMAKVKATVAPAAAPKALTEAQFDAIPKDGVPQGAVDHIKEMALKGDEKSLAIFLPAMKEHNDMPEQVALIEATLAAMNGATAAVEDSPKEGDTKQGAEGMLVFKDGRWRKVGEPEPVALTQAQMAGLIDSIPIPKLSGTNSKKFKSIIKDLKATAVAGGAEALAEKVKISTPTGKNMNIIAGGYKFALSMDPDVASDNANKVKAYILALQAAASGKPLPAAPAETPAEPKAKTAPAVSGGQIEKVGELHALVADNWKQVGAQAGSNPGGLFEDEKGNKWYCKFPNDPEAVKNELLAAKFYQMLGVDVPNLRLVKQNGKLGIASGWVDGVKKGSAGELAAAEGAHKGFVFDAWLANWDVVGMANDNLLLDKQGKAVRIDVGGSLVFRAMGGKKGEAFSDDVPELATLLDPVKNANSASVFAGVSDADIKAGVSQLNKLKPSQIEELVAKAGPGTDADKSALAAKLIARRAFILKHYKARDQWDKKPVDEAKVKVSADDIPAGIDFFHHPDKGGQPLSSKEWLNKQNTLDSAALAAFAKEGNLKALKDYHYQSVDSHGQAAGLKPITSHPSNHIQKQWASLVQTLQSVAYPPAETLEMPSFGFGGTLEEMGKQVGAFAPHENVTTVPAEHRLGYFMSLAKLDSDTVQEYVSEKEWKFQPVGGDFDKAGKANYQKTSKLVKNYISGVQASGSINHLWSQGKAESGLGVSTQVLTKTIYDEALAMPEGTTLLRWMDDDTAGDIMTQQLKDCSAGTVIQNTDSMCTSFKESWGKAPHFCTEPKKAILMNIRCANGSKATPSHGSGHYGGESEITTLPGQRFLIVSVKQGDHRHPDGIVVDCILLPPDEGFVAQLAQPSPLTKSENWSTEEWLNQPNPQARRSVIVFLREPLRSPMTVISAVRL